MGLTATASLTTNPLLLVLVIAVAGVVVGARRSDHRWARSFRLYLLLGLAIVVIRVVFRLLLGGGALPGDTVLWPMPEIPLPSWVAGVRLLGDATKESLLSGLYDGLRLAALVICVGAANSLANPKRLLKSMPAALHEIGTAVVVAVSVMPQLAESVQRVRAAQRLRGGSEGRVRGLRRLVVPVLEDALERSLTLAAGMDSRGYGRSGGASRAQRRVTGALLLTALCGMATGIYALLDTTAPRVLAGPLLAASAVVAAAGFVAAGRRVRRTKYRAERWRLAEVVVACAGLVPLVVAVLAEPAALHPGVEAAPTLLPGLLAAVLVAALPAVVAPPPVRQAPPTRRTTPPAPDPRSSAPRQEVRA